MQTTFKYIFFMKLLRFYDIGYDNIIFPHSYIYRL